MHDSNAKLELRNASHDHRWPHCFNFENCVYLIDDFRFFSLSKFSFGLEKIPIVSNENKNDWWKKYTGL